jgi:hypothetical protein
MAESRVLFISYVHVPNYVDATSKLPVDVPTSIWGFGEMSVEVDYPIRNRDDLSRALDKGLAEKGVTGKRVMPMHWRFYED